MIAQKLKAFLDNQNVKYVTITHSPAFTAQEVAESAHVPGRVMAKTVMLKIDDAMAMAVVPSHRRVLLDELNSIADADDVCLAREEEFNSLFPDCEAGAMPPFGNLYDMSVYVSPDLAEEYEIAFNAGSHTEIIRMTYRDFERLVHPHVGNFAS